MWRSFTASSSRWGTRIAHSVERATPGEEALGSGFDPHCGRPLPTAWVDVSIMGPAETEVMVSPLCLVSLGTRPRYSLVVDEDVKKQTN